MYRFCCGIRCPLGECVKRRLVGYFSVADQYGHRTKLGPGPLNHRLHGGKIRDVRTGGHGTAASGHNFGRDLLGRFRACRIIYAHSGAPLRGKKRDPSADAARSAP